MKLKIRRERLVLAMTLLRIVLAFIVGILIISGRQKIAGIFFIFTAVITFFEGITSQKLATTPLIKSILDFFADRFLINIVTITLALKGMLPWWVMLIFLLRDLIAVVIAFTLIYRDSRREFKLTALGKITLFFQIIALIPVVMGNLDWVLIWIAIGMTFIAGIQSLFESEFRMRKKKSEMDEFKILRLIKFADMFTLTNVVFGILSILFSLKGWFIPSSIMMLLSVIPDYMDGKVAKTMNQQNDFGRELDSLADTVSFGIAPAIFGFTLIQTPLAVLSFTVFLFCGILRLARYNIMNLKGAFQGMPITLNGIFIPVSYFIAYYFKFSAAFLPYLYLVLGILMVSNLRIKRIG